MAEPPESTPVLYLGEIPALHGPASVTTASRLHLFAGSLMSREWRYLEPIALIGHDGF